MTTIASQITNLTVVYSWGIHRSRWIHRTKGQLRGKCFHLMTSSWSPQQVTSITWANIGHDVWHYMVPLGHNELKIFLRICLNGQKPLTHWGRDKMAAISQTIFLNGNLWISIKISLKFVPKGLFNNIPELVQIMAWRRLGDKPLSEPMMVR